MKGHKTLLAAAAVFILLAVMVAGVFAETSYRELKKGDSGPDVLALKERLFDLGYITSKNFEDDYNKNTAERIRQLQKKNGLRQTGIATPELQELIFSDECIGKDGKKRAASDGNSGQAPARFLMPEPAGKTKIPLDEDALSARPGDGGAGVGRRGGNPAACGQIRAAPVAGSGHPLPGTGVFRGDGQ